MPIVYIIEKPDPNSVTATLRYCRYLSSWWIRLVRKSEKSNKIRLLNGYFVIRSVCRDITWRKRCSFLRAIVEMASGTWYVWVNDAKSRDIAVEKTAWLRMSQFMRIWYLSHMRAAKAQVRLRIRAVSPEPSLLAHSKKGRRWRLRLKVRHLAPLDSWSCRFKGWLHAYTRNF